MKTINIRGTQAVSRCKKRRKMEAVKASDITLESFKRTRITRGAIDYYKNSDSVTLAQVDEYINEKFAELKFPAETIREINKAEVVTLVHKYLDADPRRSQRDSKQRKYTYTFAGVKVSYKPDFLYESEIETPRYGMVPLIEVVSLTTSTQKHLSNRRYGSGKENSSLHHNLDGLGMILFGLSCLNGRTGIIRCFSDALKTEKDKGGDYSRDWQTAEMDDSGVKSSDNRVWIEVRINELGHIVLPAELFYPLGSPCYYNNTRWNNKDLFKGYEETLRHYIEGKDICTSKEECKSNCEYYEICTYNHIPISANEAVLDEKQAVEPSLNLQQQKVAAFREGIACVDAGPGSGKTQVMAYRIANMIKEGEKLSDFLILSFSKAAVKTITDRVSFFVNDLYGMNVDIRKIKVGTFNSFGDALINKYYKELGYSEIPELADEVDFFNVVKDAIDFDHPVDGFDYKNYKMRRMGNNYAGGVVSEIAGVITELRSNGTSKKEFFETTNYTPEQAEYIWNTNMKASQIMREKNLKDYADQQYQVIRLLDEINPEAVTETYRYKHIIVDEFQDSNDFQMMFIGELINTSAFKSLMVVGDDAQAIYLFRHTSPENIIFFEEKLGSAIPVEQMLLTRNYRSTEELVELGNEVLEHNTTKVKKLLESNRGKSGHTPTLKSFEKSTDEVRYICDNIEKLIKSGVKPTDIAVICATKSSLKTISKELSRRNMLSQYDMGERLLDNSRVRSFIGFCNFATDPSATKGLLEYLNEMYNGRIFDLYSPKQVKNLLEKAQTDFINAYTLLSPDEKKEYVLRVLRSLDDDTDAVFTSFREMIEAKTRLDVFKLLSYIRDFYELDINKTAEKTGSYNAVSLVTAHSSKGKEWNHVFVSLSDFDKIPTINDEETEERRRLIFVAYTRSRDFLTVSTLREKNREGDIKPINPWYHEMKTYKSFNILD